MALDEPCLSWAVRVEEGDESSSFTSAVAQALRSLHSRVHNLGLWILTAWCAMALVLSRSKAEIDLRILEEETKVRRRELELEAIWSKEGSMISQLEATITAIQAESRSREAQIQSLTSANEYLRRNLEAREDEILKLRSDKRAVGRSGRDAEIESLKRDNELLGRKAEKWEEEVMELRDRVSEYHRRLTSAGPLPIAWPTQRLEKRTRPTDSFEARTRTTPEGL